MTGKREYGYFVSYRFQTHVIGTGDRRGDGDTHLHLATDRPGVSELDRMREHVVATITRQFSCVNVVVTLLNFQRLPGEDRVVNEGSMEQTLIIPKKQ